MLTSYLVKTQVEFRSSKFPPYEREEEEINPGLWGKRLTEYLARRLTEEGIATEPMVMEDWGCYLPIKSEGPRLALCCGHQNGGDDQFIVFTDPSTPNVKKLFRTVDISAELAHVLKVLEKILRSDPEIRDIASRKVQASCPGRIARKKFLGSSN